MAKKNLAQIQKDFELFGKGVERLEQLKQELAALNVKGHEDDVAKIKPLLNKVSAIPQIETALDGLKKKIRSKRRRASRKKATKKVTRRKVSKKSTVKKKAKRKVKSPPKPKIKFRDARHIVRVKGEEFGDLIDLKLGDVRKDLKSRLASALEKERNLLNERLETDLLKRQESFKKKERALRTRYEREYHKRLDSELHKKVNKSFNEMLRKRYLSQKKSLDKQYEQKILLEEQRFGTEIAHTLEREQKEVRKHGSDWLSKKSAALRKRYRLKQISLKQNYNLKISGISATYQNALKKAKEKLERAYHDKLKKELGKKVSKEFNSKLQKKLKSEKLRLQDELYQELQLHQDELIRVNSSELRRAKLNQNKALKKAYKDAKLKLIDQLEGEYSAYETVLHDKYEKSLKRQIHAIRRNLSKKENRLNDLRHSLESRYKAKFGKALENRIDNEFNSKLNERLSEKRAQLIRKMEASLSRRKASLQKDYERKLNSSKSKVESKLKKLATHKKIKEVKAIRAMYAERLAREKSKLEAKFRKDSKGADSETQLQFERLYSALRAKLEKQIFAEKTRLEREYRIKEQRLTSNVVALEHNLAASNSKDIAREQAKLKALRSQLAKSKGNFANKSKLLDEEILELKLEKERFKRHLGDVLRKKVAREFAKRIRERMSKEKITLKNQMELRLEKERARLQNEYNKDFELTKRDLEKELHEKYSGKKSRDVAVARKAMKARLLREEKVLKVRFNNKLKSFSKEHSLKLDNEMARAEKKLEAEKNAEIRKEKLRLKSNVVKLTKRISALEKKRLAALDKEKNRLSRTKHLLKNQEKELSNLKHNLMQAAKRDKEVLERRTRSALDKEKKRLSRGKRLLKNKGKELADLKTNLMLDATREREVLERNYEIREQQLGSYLEDLEAQLESRKKQELSSGIKKLEMVEQDLKQKTKADLLSSRSHFKVLEKTFLRDSTKQLMHEKLKAQKLQKSLSLAKRDFDKKHAELQKHVNVLKVEKEKLHSEHLQAIHDEKKKLYDQYQSKEKALRKRLEAELRKLKRQMIAQSALELEHEMALRHNLASSLKTTLGV
jgi:hypothetical protein